MFQHLIFAIAQHSWESSVLNHKNTTPCHLQTKTDTQVQQDRSESSQNTHWTSQVDLFLRGLHTWNFGKTKLRTRMFYWNESLGAVIHLYIAACLQLDTCDQWLNLCNYLRCQMEGRLKENFSLRQVSNSNSTLCTVAKTSGNTGSSSVWTTRHLVDWKHTGFSPMWPIS